MKYHVSFDLEFKKNIYPGKFIVLEGIEASGKTTQVKRLAKILSNKGKIFTTKNPTDNEIGTYIRKEILAGNKAHIPPVSYQYLFAADRVIQQQELIDHLKRGETVICDRYFWSSVAYGIADREGTDFENWEEVSMTALSILSIYHQFILPDLTVYLDVSVEESSRRMKGSIKHTEIYDNHQMNIKIEKGYDWLLENFKNEIIRIDGEKPIDKMTEEIVKLVEQIKK
jgi:dTMP kinase